MWRPVTSMAIKSRSAASMRCVACAAGGSGAAPRMLRTLSSVPVSHASSDDVADAPHRKGAGDDHIGDDSSGGIGGEGSGSSTVDAEEVERFAAIARDGGWWRPGDPSVGLLHGLNSVRVPIIVRAAAPLVTRSGVGEGKLSGLKVLDVGCGGGILSEPLARLGASVTGIDASGDNIAAAAAHATLDPLVASRATYRHATAEELAEEALDAPDDSGKFDVVVASEVIEHVADVPAFVKACAALVKDGGALVVTTINRTPKSYALAIVAAEHVLRLVPPSTHDWSRFVTPMEVGDAVRANGLFVEDVVGMVLNPLPLAFGALPGRMCALPGTRGDLWFASDDTEVNYALVARRPSSEPYNSE